MEIFNCALERAHHAGHLVALGFCVAVLWGLRPASGHAKLAAPQVVRAELARIKPFCRWTDGAWEELGGLAWNEVQNTPQHLRLLSSTLIRAYLNNRRTPA